MTITIVYFVFNSEINSSIFKVAIGSSADVGALVADGGQAQMAGSRTRCPDGQGWHREGPYAVLM